MKVAFHVSRPPGCVALSSHCEPLRSPLSSSVNAETVSCLVQSELISCFVVTGARGYVCDTKLWMRYIPQYIRVHRFVKPDFLVWTTWPRRLRSCGAPH